MTDPVIVYILIVLGLYGIMLELCAPCSMLPCTLGAAALGLGLLNLDSLPASYAGVAFIVVGLGLLVAETVAPAHGILAACGAASFIGGSLLLVLPRSGPAIAVPVIVVAAGGTMLLVKTIVRLAIEVRRAPPTSGIYELVGRRGEVRTALTPVGQVLVGGEWWKAMSDEPLEPGTWVEVLGRQGLTLLVMRSG